MLFDKDTKRITAILYFDWASVSHPFDEFMSCLYDIGVNISYENNAIDAAIISGDFTEPPTNLDEDFAKRWEISRAWNTAMKKSDMVSPSDIKGAGKIYDIMRLQRLLCPYQLSKASMPKEVDNERRAELLAQPEANLIQWLEKYGF